MISPNLEGPQLLVTKSGQYIWCEIWDQARLLTWGWWALGGWSRPQSWLSFGRFIRSFTTFTSFKSSVTFWSGRDAHLWFWRQLQLVKSLELFWAVSYISEWELSFTLIWLVLSYCPHYQHDAINFGMTLTSATWSLSQSSTQYDQHGHQSHDHHDLPG